MKGNEIKKSKIKKNEQSRICMKILGTKVV